MSIQTELARLTNAKAAIQAAIEGKGVTVPDGTLLDGMAALIEGIEAGGGNVKDFTFLEANGTTVNPKTLTFLCNFNPDVIVATGPLSVNSNTCVGLVIHIQDVDGGIYQEKWRYQSTKYLIGTSATDGSLYSLQHSDTITMLSLKSGEAAYGTVFAAKAYKVFAAKMF